MVIPRRPILLALRNAAAFGAAVVLLAGLSMPRIVLAQEVTPVFVVPREPVAAGSPLSVWLAVMNLSDRAATYSFPASLDGRLRAAGAERSVSATLRNTSDAGETTIPPGGHVRREYVIQVPEGLEGQAVFSVPAIAANAVALEVRQAEVVATAAEAAPVEPARSPAELPKASADGGEEADVVKFFKEHFSGYEPFYFIVGPDDPAATVSAQLQVSTLQRYGPAGQAVPYLQGPPHRLHADLAMGSGLDLQTLRRHQLQARALLRGGAGGRRPLGGLAAPGSPGEVSSTNRTANREPTRGA